MAQLGTCSSRARAAVDEAALHVLLKDWLHPKSQFDYYNGVRSQTLLLTFANGGCVFLGGLEAMQLVAGENPAAIDVIVDCRGDNTIGRHHRYVGELAVPRGCTYRLIHLNRLSVLDRGGDLKFRHELADNFGQVFADLAKGKRVLIGCINGARRSSRAAALVVATAYDVSGTCACEYVQALRSIASFEPKDDRHCNGARFIDAYRGRCGRLRAAVSFPAVVRQAIRSRTEAEEWATGGFVPEFWNKGEGVDWKASAAERVAEEEEAKRSAAAQAKKEAEAAQAKKEAEEAAKVDEEAAKTESGRRKRSKLTVDVAEEVAKALEKERQEMEEERRKIAEERAQLAQDRAAREASSHTGAGDAGGGAPDIWRERVEELRRRREADAAEEERRRRQEPDDKVERWTGAMEAIYFADWDALKRELRGIERSALAISPPGHAGEGGTILHHIAFVKVPEEIRTAVYTRILDASSESLDWRNAKGMTPLHIACAHGHVEIAEMLLRRGAGPPHILSN